MIDDTDDIIGLRDARRLVEQIRNRAILGLARPGEAAQLLEEIHEMAERARPLVQAGLQSLVSAESRRIELEDAEDRRRADRLAASGFGPYAPRSDADPPADEPDGRDWPEGGDAALALANAAIDLAIVGEDHAHDFADRMLELVEMPGAVEP